MLENISISFSGMTIINNPYNMLNKHITRRVISLFEMLIEKIISFVRVFHLMIVLKSSFLEIYKFDKFDKHIVCHNLYLLKIKHKITLVDLQLKSELVTTEIAYH